MTIQILEGNCLETLKTLPEKSVQCCVTSPPYYGLRDYGTATWEGGDPNCEHKVRPNATTASSTLDGGKATTSHQKEGFRDTCPRCGAKRIDSQIGLEPTPEKYVENLVTVFREVWRVLKDDGTMWLNLGDSYAANRGYQVPDNKYVDVGNKRGMKASDYGLKPKDIIGIPWMVAFALRADGWYLRSDCIEQVELYCPCGCGYILEERIWRYSQDRDIIWEKPNQMPENVKDRPTKSHEYIFLLSKSRQYYYDAEAILEPYEKPLDRWGGNKLEANGKSEWDNGTGQRTYRNRNMRPNPKGRNRRSVWTVNTKPSREAHFATFPAKLIEPCILAGSAIGDTILDPFSGSGTTGEVAIRYKRNYIGCELNPEYIEMTMRKLNKVQSMLIW